MVRSLPISGGTVRQQEKVAATVSDNFTEKEIEAMTSHGNKPRVRIGPVKDNPNADGSVHCKEEGSKAPTEITLTKDADRTAITHEFVHLSRLVDRTRRGITRTAHRLTKNGRVCSDDYALSGPAKDIRNAEESATSAESILREKSVTDRPPVYFRDLGKKDEYGRFEHPNARDNCDHDRTVMKTHADGKRTSEGKTVKGREALRFFRRNYRNTRISRRKTGSESAIETSERMGKKNEGEKR